MKAAIFTRTQALPADASGKVHARLAADNLTADVLASPDIILAIARENEETEPIILRGELCEAIVRASLLASSASPRPPSASPPRPSSAPLAWSTQRLRPK